MKSSDLIGKLPFILLDLRMEEESRILGVRVKSVDIAKNTSGEGGFLGQI